VLGYSSYLIYVFTLKKLIWSTHPIIHVPSFGSATPPQFG
jgi:hypothetical protein